jgi:hypothetical protein
MMPDQTLLQDELLAQGNLVCLDPVARKRGSQASVCAVRISGDTHNRACHGLTLS